MISIFHLHSKHSRVCHVYAFPYGDGFLMQQLLFFALKIFDVVSISFSSSFSDAEDSKHYC